MARRNVDHIVIPDEIKGLLEPVKEPTVAELEKIGSALSGIRSEAVMFRMSHGIESTWALCEDAYNGVDEANRHEYAGAVWVKSTVMNAPLTTSELRKGTVDRRSTAFVRLTTRYVDAGSAKIGEILLPIDDKAFKFSATPHPTLIKGKDDMTPLTEGGVPLKRPARPEEVANMPPLAPGAPPAEVDLTTKDLVEEAIEIAEKKAKKAETIIYDWQVECQHNHEMRKVIFDAARLGVGVLKGPFPTSRRKKAMIKGSDGKLQLVIHDEIVPVDKWVSPWNIYPDPACGENIRDGEYVWERDFMSEKQVRGLKSRPGYKAEQIDKVLLMGPMQSGITSKNPNEKENKHPYEIWFYYGTMDRNDFEAVNSSAASDVKKDKVHVIATMINDIVIHGTTNPLDSGDLPYHQVPWIRRPGYWAGTGVAEQISVPQRIVNASTRALLNNAGITAGPQIVINQKGVRPANNDWNLSPNKIWYLSEEGNSDDVRKAFLSFDISNVGKQLDAVIMYGMRLAEESTSIPLITQGMSGPTTPDTLGAAQLQNNNANQLLRYIGYSFDGFITVPLINQYYEYLLLDPHIDDDAKGDFAIHAYGSVALVERAIQDQMIGQMTPIVQDPQFGFDPKKWSDQLLRSKHLSPADFKYSKEDQAKRDAMPRPAAPAIEVAKIKAAVSQAQMQADEKRAQEEDALARELAQLDGQITLEAEKMRNATAQLRVKLDTDRDTKFVQAETDRARADFEHNMATLQLKKDLAQLDYASKHQLSLDQVKSKLADTAMRLQTQKDLAAMDARLAVHQHHTPSADALLKPPAQTPGKAANGKAFSQV